MPWVRSATGALIIAAATAATIARGDAPARSAAKAAPPSDSAVTVLAAGDVAACWLSGAKETARILDRNPGTILVVGDAAYKSTHAPDPLRQCYDPTWGRFRDRTYAVPGNHEYESGQIG
ncbi:MAG TPA: hypothetical protein VJ867_16085, partial [Gemmatimonadaceae bacterium]|nr:hypothetical protein [Gemmatimonadaceae bacterium]